MDEEKELRQRYTAVNSATWDRWADGGNVWSIPISHEEYEKARLHDDWGMYLTPVKYAPREWFPELRGARVLGLASGGGQQMPIFAARGAICTIFDNSERQLASERMVAAREGYGIEIVRGDMTKPLPFADGSFDLIFHPVSNCYVEDVQHVWNECFRILKKGGVLLAGMDNGLIFLFDEVNGLTISNRLPFNPLKDRALFERMTADNDGIQFSHTAEEQLGGQLRAGLTLTHILEDTDRPGTNPIGEYMPLYYLTRAVK
ncbi:MAG TPA: class I SAM-dependent methyltransferase [Clostridia bacterium]|nr:class I SAM-dependent methyltransferase [Clostridia bacterium]